MTIPHLGALWWVMIAGCVAGLLTVLYGPFRTGGYIIAGSMAFAALVRAVLPSGLTKGIAIRSRPMDVLFYLAGAATIAVIFTEVRLGAAY